MNSAIELKRLHDPGYPRSADGELMVLNDGDVIDGGAEGDVVRDNIDDMFDEPEDEYESDDGILDENK